MLGWAVFFLSDEALLVGIALLWDPTIWSSVRNDLGPFLWNNGIVGELWVVSRKPLTTLTGTNNAFSIWVCHASAIWRISMLRRVVKYEACEGRTRYSHIHLLQYTGWPYNFLTSRFSLASRVTKWTGNALLVSYRVSRYFWERGLFGIVPNSAEGARRSFATHRDAGRIPYLPQDY